MSDKIMYRSEIPFGCGYRDASKVMAYEVFELGNTDILYYLNENYKLTPKLQNTIFDFIDELNNNGFVDDMFEDEKEQFMKDCLSEIKKETNVDVKYSLWLARKSIVKNYYGKSYNLEEDEIDAYDVSNAIVLSDLGESGKLYGFEENPMPLEKENEIERDDNVEEKER